MSAEPLGLRFAPSRLQLDAQDRALGGYRAWIDAPGQPVFNGLVDYEVRVASLDLASAQTFRGQWRVSEGRLEVGPGQAIPTGFYMTRVKPAGRPETEYGDWAIIGVDRRPLWNASLAPSDQSLRLPPPPGSSMIFENLDAAGRRLGYTRVDVETEPGTLGGATLRFTKTARDCYWQPGQDWNLRWALRHRSTPWGSMLVSPGGQVHRSPWPGLGAERLNVRHPGNRLGDAATQGLLGGFGRLPARERLELYEQADDMWLFYALLPPGDRVPAGLDNRPQALVDLAWGRPNRSVDIDLWHAAALAPTRPSAALRMRYAETGAKIGADRVDLAWSVVEDWEWRPDGLIERIAQYAGVPPLAWRKGIDMAAAERLKVELRLVDYDLPDRRPLRLELWDPEQGKGGAELTLGVGAEYQLVATRADGRPYSGFLEVEVHRLFVDGVWRDYPPGSRSLWRDREGKPIYVSDGRVAIGGPAHGNPTDWGVVLSARPYLANPSINALYPTPDTVLIPNASAADMSNTVRLSFGFTGPPPA